MTQLKITDDLDALLGVLPGDIVQAVHKANDYDNLLEIILDLGRVPTARYVQGEMVLNKKEITRLELDHVVERIGEFDADNRAGLERTLHRISCLRNRRGHIVGLTCRVGRAVYGTVDIIQDIVESGKSLLILGRPGVGKTTLLREAARILAESKRVIVVDTSNEIGGDGDVPHPAVGKARRMQVREPMLQHEVMIEAVENHNPEVIVIDEIGRELEAAAARTIAERGVQLIGTAHGQTIDNLLLNPTLSDLIGGIEAVTLSDEEARRRGTQKRCSNGVRRPPSTCWSRSRRVTVLPSTWILPPRSTRFCAATRSRRKSVRATPRARSRSRKPGPTRNPNRIRNSASKMVVPAGRAGPSLPSPSLPRQWDPCSGPNLPLQPNPTALRSSRCVSTPTAWRVTA